MESIKARGNRGLNRQLWRNMFQYFEMFRNKIIILIANMIFLGVLDSIYPQLIKYAIDEIADKKQLDKIPGFAVIYILVVAAIASSVGFLIFWAGRIDVGICYQLRKKCKEKLIELDVSYFDKNSTGHIVSTVISDIGKIGQKLAWCTVDIVWGACLTLFIIIMMLWMNYKLALIALSTLPVLMLLSFLLQKKALNESRKVRKINSEITSWFSETIAGSKTIKLLNCEEANSAEFGDIANNMNRNSVKAAALSALYLPLVMTLGSVGMAMAIYYGGLKASFGEISPGTLAAFMSYLSLLFAPVKEFSRVLTELISAQAAAERVLELLHTEPKIKESTPVMERFGTFLEPKKENWPKLHGEVEFKGISFHYHGGQRILKNINLKVEKGQNLAIVGETGSGKTTMVNLLLRFLEPVEGEVLIDGIDYRERSQKWLHSNIGYVIQTPFIFSGTIKENISYGNPNAAMEEIEEVSKACGLKVFINSLKEGYDTVIGEGGASLSLGQKQLISIARVMLLNPAIVVLDEATSSIDTITEEIVKESIKNLLKGRTSFVIAHRLSTIRNSDRIIVLDSGSIIESGTHDELISRKGRYFNLYQSLTA